MSDYDDFFEISEEAAKKAVSDAEFVLDEIERYLNSLYEECEKQ